jgi:hypothetical protein
MTIKATASTIEAIVVQSTDGSVTLGNPDSLTTGTTTSGPSLAGFTATALDEGPVVALAPVFK